jgi:predicted hydrocarbon binding protein
MPMSIPPKENSFSQIQKQIDLLQKTMEDNDCFLEEQSKQIAIIQETVEKNLEDAQMIYNHTMQLKQQTSTISKNIHGLSKVICTAAAGIFAACLSSFSKETPQTLIFLYSGASAAISWIIISKNTTSK